MRATQTIAGVCPNWCVLRWQMLRECWWGNSLDKRLHNVVLWRLCWNVHGAERGTTAVLLSFFFSQPKHSINRIVPLCSRALTQVCSGRITSFGQILSHWDLVFTWLLDKSSISVLRIVQLHYSPIVVIALHLYVCGLIFAWKGFRDIKFPTVMTKPLG